MRDGFVPDRSDDPGVHAVAAARDLEQELLGILGVVDTGLFLGTADIVLVGHSDRSVTTSRRTGAGQ
jgi:ribose 5-phosphate isomerase